MVIILLYVLLGIIIYAACLPLLEELVTTLTQAIEIVKGKLILKAAKIQKEVDELTNTTVEEEKTQTHVIGFQIPSDDYEEEYEEDE